MTVQYSADVRRNNSFAIVRLFFRWRGNVWKAIYKELFLWILLYAALNVSYRFLMNDYQQGIFEKVCLYFKKETEQAIPITFMLGFFVSIVFNRWWTMWTNIGWIDDVATYLLVHIPGRGEKARLYRRNIVRLILTLQVIIFRDICTSIRNRFPDINSLVVAGYFTEDEKINYQNTTSAYKNYYSPFVWAMDLIERARKEHLISSDLHQKGLMDTVHKFKGQVMSLLGYDFQPIPLLYTVVVCLTVRLYFLVTLLSQQSLIVPESLQQNKIDLYVPIITILQFLFYFGWLKVAEAMLNPFGDDDDDFECNWLIDRNMEVAYIIVDDHPDVEPTKDIHWNQKRPIPMYSSETLDIPVNPLVASVSRRPSLAPETCGKAPAILPGDLQMHPRIPENSNEDCPSLTAAAAGAGDPSFPAPKDSVGSRTALGVGVDLLGSLRRKLSLIADSAAGDKSGESVNTPVEETYQIENGNRLNQQQSRRRSLNVVPGGGMELGVIKQRPVIHQQQKVHPIAFLQVPRKAFPPASNGPETQLSNKSNNCEGEQQQVNNKGAKMGSKRRLGCIQDEGPEFEDVSLEKGTDL